jgi:succinoglycan biosynthesis transport protein ExoP
MDESQLVHEGMPAGRSDLRSYMRILWRWKFLFLAIVLIIPIATYFYERGRPKVYQASTLVEITGGQSTGLAELLSGNNIVETGPDTTDLLVDATLVSTDAIAEEAAKFLHPRPADPTSLVGSITTNPDQSTGFLTITASAGSPDEAANIANAFAQALAENQTHATVAEVSATIVQLQRQIRNINRGNPERPQLAAELARLRALQASEGANVQIIQTAAPPGAPVAPRVARSVILALIVALLLAIGAVALAEASDRRVRHPDEVSDFTGAGDPTELPLLGAVPTSAFSSGGALSHEAKEAFVTLRAALTYFNVDRRVGSVLITSPGKEDGKTTVAMRLAEAFARGGKSVILVDADLRRPAIARRFGILPSEGLAAVLVGELSLDKALVSQAAANGGSGGLLVLPAGPPPPNPSELLASTRMQELLSDLTKRADIVLIDSSPLLTVSDSMPLLPLVSGVILIARVNRTSRDAMARLRVVVRAAGGNALGVVTTAAATGGLYAAPGYGYESAYTAAEANGSPRKRGRPWRRKSGNEAAPAPTGDESERVGS